MRQFETCGVCGKDSGSYDTREDTQRNDTWWGTGQYIGQHVSQRGQYQKNSLLTYVLLVLSKVEINYKP